MAGTRCGCLPVSVSRQAFPPVGSALTTNRQAIYGWKQDSDAAGEVNTSPLLADGMGARRPVESTRFFTLFCVFLRFFPMSWRKVASGNPTSWVTTYG
jgi:hypothetical protein